LSKKVYYLFIVFVEKTKRRCANYNWTFFILFVKIIKFYLKPTAACQTKANNRKKIGIIGSTSTKGSKIWYASGSFAKRRFKYIRLILAAVLHQGFPWLRPGQA